jgi:class 3 adenylate cyclase
MAFRQRIFQSASADRFDALIEERLRPGADRASIDRRIWDLFGEEWCVMATDLSGFSRGVAELGIIHCLQTIHESERLLVPVVERHDGILLKVEGDSFLVIFRSVSKALQAAVAMQREVRANNDTGKPPEEHVLVGIGLGFGRVLHIGDADVFGCEVNAACMLGEDIAKAWEILVTAAVRQAAGELPGIAFEPIERAPPGTGGAFRVRYER